MTPIDPDFSFLNVDIRKKLDIKSVNISKKVSIFSPVENISNTLYRIQLVLLRFPPNHIPHLEPNDVLFHD